MNPIRVLVVDDHSVVRNGVCKALQQHASIKIIGEANGGLEALDWLDKEQPDVMLLDISMPDLDGLDVAARVADEFPSVRVIILSSHGDSVRVHRALQSGVVGYILKDSTDEVVRAVYAVGAGQTYVSTHVLRDPKMGQQRNPRPLEFLAVLPERQRHVLRLMVAGHDTDAIAQELNVPVTQVEAHRTRLMARLGVHDMKGLTQYARRVGLAPSAS